MSFRRIGLVGYGRFGRAFCDLCSEKGFEVTAFDPAQAVPPHLQANGLAGLGRDSEAVILALPVHSLRGVLLQLSPYLESTRLIFDVSSVKTSPVQAFRTVLGDRVPWIGTHPLFGPTSVALGERPLRVVVCPTPEHPTATDRARDFFHRLGCEVLLLSPDEHDRTMATTHALAFFLAKGLLDIGVGASTTLAPPSFQAIARTIEAVRSDAGHLFVTIERDNPYAAEAREQLLHALTQIHQQIGLQNDALSALDIPDLGPASPDLRATRDLIDELDRSIVDLLVRRAQLSQRAGRAKAAQGKPVRDPQREEELLRERAEWAQRQGLDVSLVRDVFDAILRVSRMVQGNAG